MESIPPIKILHIAYSINEQSAAYRLAEEQALQKSNQIYFLLARKSTSSFIETRRLFPTFTSFIGIFSHLMDYIFNKCLVQSGEVFSMGINMPFKNIILKYLILKSKPQVIHIHWGGYSFITPKLLLELSRNTNIKVVVTTHDYYYFTGGCHIPMNCAAYLNNCINCPISKNSIGRNWVESNRRFVNKLLDKANIIFVSPSKFANNFIKRNRPNLISDIISNTAGNIFCIDSSQLNEGFELFERYRLSNNNVPTLLIVGVKKSLRQNKGNDIVLELFSRFSNNGLNINIITVGDFLELDVIGTHIHYNKRTIKEMQKLYFHVDLCVVPSRYETFSQVSLESIQSATPVVAFDLTGPLDIIQNGISGFLVKSFKVDDFFSTIKENLNYKLNNKEVVIQSALNTSNKFSPSQVATKYQSIYSLMNQNDTYFE